jgi:hypothetical protein
MTTPAAAHADETFLPSRSVMRGFMACGDIIAHLGWDEKGKSMEHGLIRLINSGGQSDEGFTQTIAVSVGNRLYRVTNDGTTNGGPGTMHAPALRHLRRDLISAAPTPRRDEEPLEWTSPRNAPRKFPSASFAFSQTFWPSGYLPTIR